MVNVSGVSLRITHLLAAAAISGSATIFSLPAVAQNPWYDPRWAALSPSERIIIDRVAAEIFADALQAQRAAGARYDDPRNDGAHYRMLAETQKAPFRAYAISQLTSITPRYAAEPAYQPAPQYQTAPQYQPAPQHQNAPEPVMANEI